MTIADDRTLNLQCIFSGIANIYFGASIIARNVFRFFCTCRFLFEYSKWEDTTWSTHCRYQMVPDLIPCRSQRICCQEGKIYKNHKYVLKIIFSHIIQFWVNPSAVSGVPNQTQHRPTKIKKDQSHGRPNPMSPFSPNKWVTIPQFLLSMLKINPNQSNSLPIYGPSQSSWECPLVSKTKDSVHWVSFYILTWPYPKISSLTFHSELLDINETYKINFPSGYCRSILTVPWVELGGECQITSSTGYRADVKFHTKPMFGGKLHRVTCNAFEPDVRFWISLNGVIFYFRQLNLLLILMAIGMLNISGRLIRKVPLNSSILALYQPKTKWWKHSITKNQPNLDACGVKLLRNGFLILMKFSILFIEK